MEGRNFYTTKGRTGQGNDAYFMRPSYVTVGDPFKQGALMSLGRTVEKEGHLKAGHERAFLPAKALTHERKGSVSTYEYMEEGPPKKASFRDEDGEVKTGSRNFLTNPMKLGRVGKGVTLGGIIEYSSEDYNMPGKVAKQEREYHESKIQEKPFS